jgi:hypothetical protein
VLPSNVKGYHIPSLMCVKTICKLLNMRKRFVRLSSGDRRRRPTAWLDLKIFKLFVVDQNDRGRSIRLLQFVKRTPTKTGVHVSGWATYSSTGTLIWMQSVVDCCSKAVIQYLFELLNFYSNFECIEFELITVILIYGRSVNVAVRKFNCISFVK